MNYDAAFSIHISNTYFEVIQSLLPCLQERPRSMAERSAMLHRNLGGIKIKLLPPDVTF